MLLDGIYYGKTPIARAYKGEEIIWLAGTVKWVDFDITNICSGILAYITPAASGLLAIEYQVGANTDIIVRNDESAIVYIGTDTRLITSGVNGTSDVAKHLPSSENIHLDHQVVERISKSELAHTDSEIDLNLEVSLVDSLAKQNILIFKMRTQDKSDMHSSKSKSNLIDNAILTHDIMYGRASSSRDSVYDEALRQRAEAISRDSPSKSENVDEKIIVGVEDDINIPQSCVTTFVTDVVDKLIVLMTASQSEIAGVDEAFTINSNAEASSDKIAEGVGKYQASLGDNVDLQSSDCDIVLIIGESDLNADCDLYSTDSETIEGFLDIISENNALIQSSTIEGIGANYPMKFNKLLHLVHSTPKGLYVKYDLCTQHNAHAHATESHEVDIVENINFGSVADVVSSDTRIVIIDCASWSDLDVNAASSEVRPIIVFHTLSTGSHLQANLSPGNEVNIDIDICASLYDNASISDIVKTYIRERLAVDKTVIARSSSVDKIHLCQMSQINHRAVMSDGANWSFELSGNISLNSDFKCNNDKLRSWTTNEKVQSGLSATLINATPCTSEPDKLFEGKYRSNSVAILGFGDKWQYPEHIGTNLFIPQVCLASLDNGNLKLI